MIGFRLQEDKDFTVFYSDFKKHLGRDARTFNSSIMSKSLLHFRQPQLLLIIDNAHLFPQLSYQLATWAIDERINLLLVSRPISNEMCDEKQYFPGLFEEVIHEGTSVDNDDTTFEGIPLDDEDVLYKSDISEEDVSKSLRPPSFNINSSSIENIHKVINWQLGRLGKEYRFEENELEELSRAVDYNLLLTALLLENWNPEQGIISDASKERIFNTLKRRFMLDRYPEIYLLAVMNHISCPVDLNALFDDEERKSAFLLAFFSSGSEATGLILKRRNLLFGLDSAEAKLLLDTGVFFKEAFFRDESGRLATSEFEVMRMMIIRYALRKPSNPIQLLRSLRWAAFEAAVSEDLYQEELYKEIIISVLSCSEFVYYLRDVIIPDFLSMLQFGNIVRLYQYVTLPRQQYSEVINREVILKLIARYGQSWASRHPGVERWFTWREGFAWRHLNRLDPELAAFFIEQFEFKVLLLHAKNSVQGLTRFLLIAANTDSLKKVALSKLDDLFGDTEDFVKNFKHLSEVGIIFLLRNASLLDNTVIDHLKYLISAKQWRR